MKLFNVSVINSFSAKSVNEAVRKNKISNHQFMSNCGRFICELSITNSDDGAALSYTVTFKCTETQTVIIKEKREAVNVANLKDNFKTTIQSINENNPEIPTTEDSKEKQTISRVLDEHGYTKCKMDGFEIVNDPEGREVCRMRGSLRSRLTYKWLIVDSLVNGRHEEKNEDDFSALNVGAFFELTFENGSTVSAGKVDDLQLVYKVSGRYTTIVFQRHWLVTVNPAHTEAFSSLPIGTELKFHGDHFIVRSHSIGEEGEPRAGFVNVKGEVMSLSIESMLSEIESGKSKRIEPLKTGAVQIDLKHTIKSGDVLLCGKNESTVKYVTKNCTVRTAYDGGPDQVDFNDWLSKMLYRGTLIIKRNNTDRFLSLPIGHPFACDLLSGEHIPEAIKISEQEITFKHYGKMKTVIFEPGMTCDTDWPISPDLKLIQDPYNHVKQYILKRENFLEITVFQLVHGHQVGRAKFTESELLSTFDFIHQYQLNKLLSGNCNSADRLYKIKRAFLSGVSKNWRIEAKQSCTNPHSLGFMTHTAKENELKPLALRTAEAIKKTRPGRGVKCWWMIPSIDSALRDAEKSGFVRRVSITQVEWTTEGIEALNAANKLNFTVYKKAA